jgi:hypothetical protein
MAQDAIIAKARVPIWGNANFKGAVRSDPFLLDHQLTRGYDQVNSVDCAPSNGPVWPYSSSGSVSASAISQIGSSLGSYSIGQGSSIASMTPASSQVLATIHVHLPVTATRFPLREQACICTGVRLGLWRRSNRCIQSTVTTVHASKPGSAWHE